MSLVIARRAVEASHADSGGTGLDNNGKVRAGGERTPQVLRRFVYLDADSLGEYITAVEGGLVTESTRRSMRSGSAGAGVDKIVRVGGERARENEESQTVADTDEARFDRLLRAAGAEPDALGWIDVTQPDLELPAAGIGAMVSWECDLFLPESIKVISKSGEALDALELMQSVLPMAKGLGLDTEGLPEGDEVNAMIGLLGGMNASLVIVGDDEDTEWKVAGKLADAGLRTKDVEGRARIVGKVTKHVAPGRWQPYLTFPGMNLASREDRRRLERQKPEPGKEDDYLAGPALMLDVLAIYR